MEIEIWRTMIEEHNEWGRHLWYDPARKFIYFAAEPFEWGHDLICFARRLIQFTSEDNEDVVIRVEVILERMAREEAMRIWEDPTVDIVAVQRGKLLHAFGRPSRATARWCLDTSDPAALLATAEGWQAWREAL